MKRILVPVALVATMAIACSQGSPRVSHAATTTPTIHLISALQSTDSCGDLLSWIHAQARPHVGPYGFDDTVGYAVPGVYNGVVRDAPEEFAPATSESLSDQASSKQASADSSASGVTTGTNDQEAGVDEPDQFKSDGHRVVMTDGQRLMSIDISGPTPQRLGELDLPMTGARLFLRGDHVLAVGQTSSSNDLTPGGLLELVDVDLSGGAPRIAAQASVDGHLIDGRLADGTIRLVVSTPEPTRVPFVNAANSDGKSNGPSITDLNRKALDQSTIAQWIPSWTPPGGSPTPLEDCSSVFHPHNWAGPAMLSVLSITSGLADLHPVGVVTDAQTIYASTSALYVATQETPTPQWSEGGTAKIAEPAADTTSIHRFDISGQGAAVYQGSGSVPGTVLDQYSMSEQNGDLGVVSSTSPSRIVEPMPAPVDCSGGRMCPLELPTAAPTASGDPAVSSPTTAEPTTDPTTTLPAATTVPSTTVPTTDPTATPVDPSTTTTTDASPTTTAAPSTTTTTTAAPANGTMLTVLALQGDQLTPVGSIAGLAPGEQVKTVRFVGNQAYIVTFHQVDPLFVVDVSDPTAPKLLGQVMTPGFSAYLHPVGPNLLFGVGTTIDKYNEPNGSKVSLYDTTDPTHPTEVASIPLPGQGTSLDSDPHGFTWDAAHHLAFVSTNAQGYDGTEHDGMFVYRVEGHTITWVGFIDHSAHGGTGGATSSPGCGAGMFCPDIAIAQAPSPANRVIVNGDRVLAASDNGVSDRPVSTLVESAWIGW